MKKFIGIFLLIIISFAKGFWNVELTPPGSDNRPSMKKEDMMTNEQTESHTEARVISLSEQSIYGVTGSVFTSGLILKDKDRK